MESINFDTGYKTYVINGDERNVIRVNLADPNILTRARETLDVLTEYKNSIKGDEDIGELYGGFDKLMKQKLDEVFGQGVSKAVFGDLNCMTVANEQGECIFETFMNAFLPLIERDLKTASRNSRRHIAELVDARKLDAISDEIKGAV